MNNPLFKKLISLFLILAMVFSVSLSLISCNTENVPPESEDNDESENNELIPSGSYLDLVVKPEVKDYERGTVNFDAIVYERPDFNTLTALAENVTSAVNDNTLSYEEQIEKIKTLDNSLSGLLTMYVFAKIYSSKDASVEYWIKEYEYISQNYSAFIRKIEDLKVACANSAYAQSFEDEIFGEGFIEEYIGGSKLTDEAIKLSSDEAALISEYNSISTATVTITYGGATDTVDNILEYYKTLYKEGSSDYISVYTICLNLYEKEYLSKSKDIFIELVKVRRLLADEMGYDNYIDYSYSERGLDYTSDDVSNLLSDIADYVLPVYIQLQSYVFYYYFSTELPTSVSFDTLLNTSYDVLKKTDEDLWDIYCYMLQHRLFDIDKEAANRSGGAFTAYLNDYKAPFLFMTGEENILDYTTLFHEFGHFADNFLNDGVKSSTDVSEISSQALELLIIEVLSEELGDSYKTYLLYSSLKNALEALAYQGFYARFEEQVYLLEYSDITETRIIDVIKKATDEFMINSSTVYKIEHVMIPHFITNPIYVHSYCTSVIPSLELYFLEEESEGAGFVAYKKVLCRDGNKVDFLKLLNASGLTSPFAEGHLKKIADKIHYRILGTHYYDEAPPENIA